MMDRVNKLLKVASELQKELQQHGSDFDQVKQSVYSLAKRAEAIPTLAGTENHVANSDSLSLPNCVPGAREAWRCRRSTGWVNCAFNFRGLASRGLQGFCDSC